VSKARTEKFKDTPLSIWCPHCGETLQATSVTESYYTYDPSAGWELTDQDVTQVRYYCKDDCIIDPETRNIPLLPEEVTP